MQIKTILTALAGAAVLLGVSWLLSTVVSQEDLERLLERCGAWAPAAYMGLFTLLPAFFFPVAVLALVGALMEVTALTVIGVLLVIVAVVIHFMFYRCPHCGEFLDRSTGAYCPYCGKKME